MWINYIFKKYFLEEKDHWKGDGRRLRVSLYQNVSLFLIMEIKQHTPEEKTSAPTERSVLSWHYLQILKDGNNKEQTDFRLVFLLYWNYLQICTPYSLAEVDYPALGFSLRNNTGIHSRSNYWGSNSCWSPCWTERMKEWPWENFPQS